MSNVLKEWDVPFGGVVNWVATVKATDQADALAKATVMRDEINLKSDIYINGWYGDTELSEIVETEDFQSEMKKEI